VSRRCLSFLVILMATLSGFGQGPPSLYVLIRNITVIDGTGAAPQPGVDILVQGNKIERIAPHITPPPRTQVIDGTGRFAIPGLIDLRVQLSSSPASRVYRSEVGEEQRVAWMHSLLSAGVTTVRLVQSALDEQKYFRQWQQVDLINAPASVASGPTFTAVNGSGTEQYPILSIRVRNAELYELKNVEDARTQSRTNAHSGADVFEVIYDGGPAFAPFPRLSEEVFKTIIQEAKGHELKIFCAVSHDAEAATAVADGCDAIEGVTEELLSPKTLQAMAKKKVAFVPELMYQAGSLELLDPAAMTAYLKDPFVSDRLSPLVEKSLASERGAIAGVRQGMERTVDLTPRTLAQMEEAATGKPAQGSGDKGSGVEGSASIPQPPSGGAPQSDHGASVVVTQRASIGSLMQQQADRARQNARNAKAAGVRVVIGTGAGTMLDFPGPSLHRELQMLVKLGFTPAEAIAAATSSSAAVLGKDADYGTLAPGKLAEIVVLEADPLADIANTQRINTVIHGGRKVDIDQMNQY